MFFAVMGETLPAALRANGVRREGAHGALSPQVGGKEAGRMAPFRGRSHETAGSPRRDP